MFLLIVLCFHELILAQFLKTPTFHSGSTLKRTGSDGNMLLKVNEKFDYERLKLDFRLKEADNRFLQEELENKDRMLAMLTEGLKEVSNFFLVGYVYLFTYITPFLHFFCLFRSSNRRHSGSQRTTTYLTSWRKHCTRTNY